MKRGTTRHPKTKALARSLRIPVPHAIGLLQLLWEYAAEFAPEGDVGRFPDADIADALMWPEKDAERLIQALVSNRWLDADQTWRLLVHDWPHHAEDSVRKKLVRNRAVFRTASVSSPDSVATPSGQIMDNVETITGPPRGTVKARPGNGGMQGGIPGWNRFEASYPGLVTEMDCRLWVSVIDTADEEALLFKNLALWMASEQWRDVKYIPKAENFLSKRIYRKPPPKARAEQPFSDIPTWKGLGERPVD